MRTNNIFTSTYTISNVEFDDAGIYTCTAEISHTSEYVLTSGSGSGEGSVSITGLYVYDYVCVCQLIMCVV